MEKTIKNNKGFTLVEVIFSIAFLSIISVVILRLLIASYDVENHTDLMDMATLHMSNAIENVKLADTFGNEDTILKTFYDETWQIVSESKASYVVVLVVEKNILYEKGLYNIEASVVDLLENDTLIAVKTKHYYHKKG